MTRRRWPALLAAAATGIALASLGAGITAAVILSIAGDHHP